MSNRELDLIFHPVRIRILTTLHRHGPATTTDLLERIPGVTRRSLYRHVRDLFDGGLLSVASTRQVRGTVERFYELADETQPSARTVASMSAADWQRAFALFTSTLQAEFAAFIEQYPRLPERPWSLARIEEVVAPPARLRAALDETLARLENLDEPVQRQEADDAPKGQADAPARYRVAMVAFPLDEPVPGVGVPDVP